jgi:hypothetical protein
MLHLEASGLGGGLLLRQAFPQKHWFSHSTPAIV